MSSTSRESSSLHPSASSDPLAHLPGLGWTSDAARRRTELVSGDVERVLGVSPEVWSSEGAWGRRIHPDDRERVLAETMAAIAERRDHELAYRVSGDEGRITWVREQVRVVGDGDSVRLLGITIDDTAHRVLDDRLRASEERYALAVRGANDGLWDWSVADDALYVSPRWKAMLGLSEDAPVARAADWFALVHADDLPRLHAEIDDHMAGRAPHLETEHRVRHADGTWRWVLTRGLAVRGVDGKATRMAGSHGDITARKEAEERLWHSALHDALTELPNRTLFVDQLSGSVARSKRHRDYLFAVIALDLDRFQLINDSLGHEGGDEVIREIARRLKVSLREGDAVARLGGDEFAVLLDDLESEEQALGIAARVQEQLGGAFDVRGQEIFATCSMGIALSTTGYSRPEDALRDADTALHGAKAHGRGGREVFAAQLHEDAVQALKLQSELRRAVDRKEFRVVFQPIVRLESGRIDGFEALLRWEHPERGLVMPAQFIAHVEDTGLVVEVGAWILRQACREVRRWQDELRRDPPLTLSVNLSTKQFAHEGLLEEVSDILADTNFPAKLLKLEITESALVGADALVKLQGLRALGAHLQVDDFGTGYSSLSYLQKLPVDSVKIDQSFVQDAGKEGLQIVRTVVALADVMSLDVVAEGIETREQRDKLRALGCDLGQGYLFSKPVPADEALALLRSDPTW